MTPARTPDPDLLDRRRLADILGLPDACPHPACRRAGRCAGPRGTTDAFPGAVLPDCLATGFEALYRPVAAWQALMADIDDAAARLAAGEGGTGRGSGWPGRARP